MPVPTLTEAREQMRSMWDAQRYPRLVYVETTNVCNAKCKFCLYGRMERAVRTMSQDEFTAIARKVNDAGLKIGAMFCFGEPLADPGLFDKIRFGKSIGVMTPYLGLNTNGSLLRADRFADIVETCSNLTISIMNVGTAFEHLTGLDWDRCYSNAIAFIKYRDAHAPGFKIEIGCNDVTGHDRTAVRNAFEGYRIAWARDAQIEWGGKTITGVIDRSIMYHNWACDGFKGAMQIKPNGDCEFCAYDVVQDETRFANIYEDSWEEIERRFKQLWKQPSSLCLRCDFWNNYYQMIAGGWKRGPHVDSSWQDAYQDHMQDYWEGQHERSEKRYLTGSNLRGVERFLNVSRLLARGIQVLEVGVGTGTCTRALVERGCLVSGMDLSRIALANAADVLRGSFHASDDLPSDAFHLAICHLVAQHMNDVDLIAMMRKVLRSLRPSGILAIQYATSPDADRVYAEDLERQKQGTVQRSPEHFERIVRIAGGEITETVPTKTFERSQATDDNQWNGCHIRRAG